MRASRACNSNNCNCVNALCKVEREVFIVSLARLFFSTESQRGIYVLAKRAKLNKQVIKLYNGRKYH